jgi:hypothetical protein
MRLMKCVALGVSLSVLWTAPTVQAKAGSSSHSKAAAPVSAPAQAATRPVTFKCTPPGAELFVDGVKVGVAPISAVQQLTPGDHTVKFQKAGHAPYIDVFKVEAQGANVFEFDLVPVAGVARVTSNIDKARVFVDGKFACETPCVADLGVGARELMVSKGGYKDAAENIIAVAGEEIVREVKLEELPAGTNPYRPAAPPPAKWYEKWWVWTTAAGVAGAVVAGVVVPVTYATKDPIQDFNPGYSFTITIPGGK